MIELSETNLFCSIQTLNYNSNVALDLAERGQTTPLQQPHVYMPHCSDQSIYAGVTNNVSSRFNEHQTGKNEMA